MFWINIDGVERAAMDGSHAKQIVEKANLTGIALDLKRQKVCWLEASRKIGCSDYDGENHIPLFSGYNQIQSFTIDGDKIFWFGR